MPLRSYGPTVDSLLASVASLSHLSNTQARALFPGARSPDGACARLWLHHGRLEEAHQIAQDLHTPEGSFWHGIVHRREPDPGNAAYWFSNVGQHPIFPALRDRVAAILPGYAGTSFRLGDRWDPLAWIDFWERARRQLGSAAERLALEVQQAEWDLLFDYCVESPE